MNPLIIGIIIVLLVIASAYFSASETAFSSVSMARLKNLANNGNKRAKIAIKIAEEYDRTLSTILVGNNIVNIGASSLATILCCSLFGDAYGALISTVGLTIIVLIFGEILPKSLAKESSEKFAMFSAPILNFLMIVTYPVVLLFLKIQKFFVNLATSGKSSPTVTEDELKYIIESIEEEGVLEEQVSELVQSALEFDEKTVQAVLTPRVDVVAIDIKDSVENVLKIILEERYSRIPVYDTTVDNIKGILHTRDFLENIVTGKPIVIGELIKEPYFIFKTKKLSVTLAEFKRKKLHMAIVTDDYGGTLGIVTMEDLLEQLVGDIWDEDEEVEHPFIKLDDDKYEFVGDTSIEDLLDVFGLKENYINSESNSIGGFFLEIFGKVPENDEFVDYKDLHIIATDVSDQRINKVIISYKPKENKNIED